MLIRQALKSTLIGRHFYGNLKDTDRIFTNVYKDGDPFINGALKRVTLPLSPG
jgi:NADH dehydrogenase (ubiquinone) flavoprotein 1